MIYSLPQPMPEYDIWCDSRCPFLDWNKEGPHHWGYCHFLKKSLDYYDWSISECDLDYDCQWVKEHPLEIKNDS